jgi:hypothetical protein
MEFKDIVEWLAKLLPKPVRRPFAVGSTAIATAGTVLKFVEGYEWRDVFGDWRFWAASCMLCVYWLIVIVKHRKTLPWPGPVVWTVVTGMALALLFAAGATWVFGHYAYDPIGLFELRSWAKTEVSGVPAWEWELEAVRDLSASRVLLELREDPACSNVSIMAFYPLRDHATHQPTITDISPESHPNLRWEIDDLRERDHARFVMSLDGGGKPGCVERTIRMEPVK